MILKTVKISISMAGSVFGPWNLQGQFTGNREVGKFPSLAMVLGGRGLIQPNTKYHEYFEIFWQCCSIIIVPSCGSFLTCLIGYPSEHNGHFMNILGAHCFLSPALK